MRRVNNLHKYYVPRLKLAYFSGIINITTINSSTITNSTTILVVVLLNEVQKSMPDLEP